VLGAAVPRCPACTHPRDCRARRRSFGSRRAGRVRMELIGERPAGFGVEDPLNLELDVEGRPLKRLSLRVLKLGRRRGGVCSADAWPSMPAVAVFTASTTMPSTSSAAIDTRLSQTLVAGHRYPGYLPEWELATVMRPPHDAQRRTPRRASSRSLLGFRPRVTRMRWTALKTSGSMSARTAAGLRFWPWKISPTYTGFLSICWTPRRTGRFRAWPGRRESPGWGRRRAAS
jgi:hypothetical protein